MQHRTPTARQPRKASRAESRRWNLLTTLQTIAARGPTSRAEVARVTGLTKATVSTLVSELIDDDLVTELGRAEPVAAGKPPRLLGVNGRGRQIVAVDLSHQPFRAILVDLDHQASHVAIADEEATGDDAVAVVVDVVAECVDHADAPVLGVGVGTPGMIDGDGVIRDAAHLDWHHVPLRKLLVDRFGLPVAVGNDAHVSALAQLRATPDAETLLFVAVGEGIGAGLVLNGRLHTGDHLSSGEIGHVVVEPAGRECRCGSTGCLETLAAVPAIRRNGGGDLVTEAVEAGARELAATLAVVVSAIDVNHVVLGSELVAHDNWVATVAGELRARMHPARRDTVTVTATDLDDPVMAGAAALVMAEVLGVVLR